MLNPANPVSIFVPMLVVVLLTFIAFLRMGAARAGAMKSGQDPNFYRAHQGAPEPEGAVVAVRHYGNLLELPTIFYPACLLAYVLNAVGCWTLIFAWAYVAGRVVQSAVHMTYNNPAHRGLGFVLGMVAMIALWVNVGMAVFAKL
jgi:hypothetical protein